MMPKNWKVFLEGIDGGDSNDVITCDGEVIGTWSTDDSDAFYQFTPNGAFEPVLEDPFVGPLCHKIWQWHQSQDGT